MNTEIRKGDTPFYGEQTFSHGISRSGYFTLQESRLLEEYGQTLKALYEGRILPCNEAEQAFLLQLSNAGEEREYFAKLWTKYLKVIAKTKVCHSFSKSSRKGQSEYLLDLSLFD